MNKKELLAFYHDYKRQIIIVLFVVACIGCFLLVTTVLDYVVSLQLAKIEKMSTNDKQQPIDMKYIPPLLQKNLSPSTEATNK